MTLNVNRFKKIVLIKIHYLKIFRKYLKCRLQIDIKKTIREPIYLFI